ncbi:uncharacterized protein PAN0_022d6077 [Moesziomyces antarcticus]|uniref:Uncharacterized protein n=1 Tax=Pseudozyma antarctica TaxID=84753 RepID=A0A081CMF1_PSEA2|nr:uncharacterized protein PAN0_022d6077 [Moesziomyces antarcticus]GAK67847.1 hypothetical protein PAN0_022d6077 [Moesziomyces antarcticus]
MDELSLETRSVDPIIALLHPIQDAELSKCRGDAPVSIVCVALERGHAGEERTLPGTNPTPEDICKWKGLEQGANLQRKSRPSVLSDFPRLGSPSSAYPFIRLHDNLQGPSLLL